MSTAPLVKLAKATALSMLVFFSVSFITVLLHINPLHYYRQHEFYELSVGFPFTYYKQFWMSGAQLPNSGWWGGYILCDVVLTWLVVTSMYWFFEKNDSKD